MGPSNISATLRDDRTLHLTSLNLYSRKPATNMSEIVRVAQTDDEVWMVFMNSAPNNRMTREFIGELNKALDNVEKQWNDSGAKGGAVIITSQIPKSFSVGLEEADAKDQKFIASESRVSSQR